jgi:hypothetical protein
MDYLLVSRGPGSVGENASPVLGIGDRPALIMVFTEMLVP